MVGYTFIFRSCKELRARTSHIKEFYNSYKAMFSAERNHCVHVDIFSKKYSLTRAIKNFIEPLINEIT